MTPHPNSNSSWCYFYMIFKVNRISTNSGSWVSYIITMLSQVPNTIYCSAAFMPFYNLFLIFIALLFAVFISSSCTLRALIYPSPNTSRVFLSDIQRWKGRALPLPGAATLCADHSHRRPRGLSQRVDGCDSSGLCLAPLWRPSLNICGNGQEYKWKPMCHALCISCEKFKVKF